MDHWLLDFQPVAAAESLAWRRSRRAVDAFGLGVEDAAAVAAAVARRAEMLGLYDARVRIVAADTLTPPPPLEVNGRTFDLAPRAVEVEIDADYASVLRFVGALPRSVRVRRLRLVHTDDGLRAHLVLIFFVEEGNGGGDAAA